ncbi:MAG: formylmethanofuran dehydrogenase subunit B, partial [Alphaproteobacteria bacterium]
MAKAGTPEQRDSVVCPFCGLFCDDLSVAISRDRIEVLGKGCALAKELYAAIEPPLPPRVDGREASLEAACARSAEILAASHFPLVAGLGCDLVGAKAAVSLAESIGAVIDHAASDAMFKNLLPLQDKGWMATTFAEIKNRADLVILAGTDVVSRFPRFFERFVWNTDS